MLDIHLDPDMPSRFSRRDYDRTDIDGWNDPDDSYEDERDNEDEDDPDQISIQFYGDDFPLMASHLRM